MNALRWLVSLSGLVILWWLVVVIAGTEPFILPAPPRVIFTLVERWDILFEHAVTTAVEILAGLVLGTAFGCASALVVGHVRPARRWLMPVLVVSQAIPVFALAPILVLWLGYGLPSKVAMATLIIFFPVTASFLDGLRRTETGWIDLATTMTAGRPDARLRILWCIRIPAALPALGSGLRIATAVAPIGAIVGEWVGSSAGLGYLMLHANARMQTDLMFAALVVLAGISLVLYFTVDTVIRRVLPWSPDNARHADDP